MEGEGKFNPSDLKLSLSCSAGETHTSDGGSSSKIPPAPSKRKTPTDDGGDDDKSRKKSKGVLEVDGGNNNKKSSSSTRTTTGGSTSGGGGGGGQRGTWGRREHDRFNMPKANVSHIMRKALPAHARISDDAKELVQKCASSFISFVTSEAIERSRHEKRKTVTGEDMLWSLGSLGFEDYVSPLALYLQRYREVEGTRAPLIPSNFLPRLQPAAAAAASHAGIYHQQQQQQQLQLQQQHYLNNPMNAPGMSGAPDQQQQQQVAQYGHYLNNPMNAPGMSGAPDQYYPFPHQAPAAPFALAGRGGGSVDVNAAAREQGPAPLQAYNSVTGMSYRRQLEVPAYRPMQPPAASHAGLMQHWPEMVPTPSMGPDRYRDVGESSSSRAHGDSREDQLHFLTFHPSPPKK